MDSYDILKGIYSYYSKVMEENKDVIRPAYSAEDIENNCKNGIFILFSDSRRRCISGRKKSERLQEAYDMGIRLITLMWNYEKFSGFSVQRRSRRTYERSEAIRYRNC